MQYEVHFIFFCLMIGLVAAIFSIVLHAAQKMDFFLVFFVSKRRK
jgi:hypothetical protein